MAHITAQALRSQFAQINAAEVMDTHIDPKRISLRTDMATLEAYLRRHGWMIERKNGNIYGFIRIVPAKPNVVPTLRLITRSDHAAVVGSR